MEPTRLYPVITLVSLLTVEFGGWALLGFLTGSGNLSDFQERFFRAGHAHAGTLLVLALVYFVYLGRTGLSDSWQWIAGGALMLGILMQSGGFFLHMALGESDQASAGTWLTRGGGLLLGFAIATLAYAVIRHGLSLASE